MIKYKDHRSKRDNRKWWTCPRCKYRDTYFLREPNECEDCGFILPSFELLIQSEKARVMYYRVAGYMTIRAIREGKWNN